MRKQQLIIILISILFIGCAFDKTISYYPSEESFNKQKRLTSIDKISLKEIIKHYKSFNYYKKDTMFFFNLETKKSLKKIILFPQSTGHIKSRNILRFEKDSIYAGYYKSFKIDDLSFVLKDFYLNYGKKYWFPVFPKKAIIYLEKSVYEKEEYLHKILKELTNEFDAINSITDENLELRIYISLPIAPPQAPNSISID